MGSNYSSLIGCLVCLVIINLSLVSRLDMKRIGGRPNSGSEANSIDGGQMLRRWSVISLHRSDIQDDIMVDSLQISDVIGHVILEPAMREDQSAPRQDGGKEHTVKNEAAPNSLTRTVEQNDVITPTESPPPHWKRILSMPSTGYHSFNATISDLVSNRRNVPDTRDEACKLKTYDIKNLQKTSIITIFHNEARSTLLRTIHSFLDRTPEALLHEIIVVDDASTHSWLKEPLTDYLAHFERVKLIRLPRRQGLIRARMRGAQEAKGEVLYFTDSHTEANVDWLLPLLTRIRENRRVLAIPYIDPIDWKTLSYQYPSSVESQGSFLWDMTFGFKLYPKYRADARSDPTAPLISPVMVGCAHAIDRNYFFETGSYDLDMEIWGGENIEHAFRLWMCGGRVEILPCSHVGHIFKPKLPYSFLGDSYEVVSRNLVRTAEVWMDEYKDIYYATQNRVPAIDLVTLEERRQLRKDLKCKSFKWYMETIVPEIPVPPRTAVYGGEIKWVPDTDKCLKYDVEAKILALTPCYTFQMQDRILIIDNNDSLVFGNQTLGVTALQSSLHIVNPRWRRDEETEQFILQGHNLCITNNENEDNVTLAPCDAEDKAQKWTVQYHFDFSRHWDIKEVVKKALAPPSGSLYFGQMKNQGSDLCLDAYDKEDYAMTSCSRQPRYKRVLHFDDDSRLRYLQFCLQLSPNDDLMIIDCPENDDKAETRHLWHYDHVTRLLTSKKIDRCLQYDPRLSGKVVFADCDKNNQYQKWKFTLNLTKTNATQRVK